MLHDCAGNIGEAAQTLRHTVAVGTRWTRGLRRVIRKPVHRIALALEVHAFALWAATSTYSEMAAAHRAWAASQG